MDQSWHVIMIHETEQKGLFKVRLNLIIYKIIIKIWIYLESNHLISIRIQMVRTLLINSYSE